MSERNLATSVTAFAKTRSQRSGDRSSALRSSSSASSFGRRATVSSSEAYRVRLYSRTFNALLVLALVTVWAGVLLTYGPRLEADWFPPVDRSFSNAGRTDQQLDVYLQGRKLRDCPATSIAAQWVLASGTVPAVMQRPDGSIVGQTNGAAFRAGDTFLLGPYAVRIPMTALADPGALFRVTTVFQCHGLWPVAIATTLALADVPLASIAGP